MADLFAMKSPLVIRLPDGRKHIMAEYFRHPEGLLYFEVFWHQQPEQSAIHLVQGEYKGDGPWKVGDCVISVLGCHGTDPELAGLFSDWQTLMQMAPDAYPDEVQIRALAVSKGAIIGN